MDYKKTEKAYSEILDVINKYKDICKYNFQDMDEKARKHLFGIELKEKYKLDINPDDVYSLSSFNVDDDRRIAWYDKKYDRIISWSDNGKQPKDELLFEIHFGTGAYIFGDDYPTELFQEFFQELKSYNPKYIDSHNKCLYFSIAKASKIFNKYPAILKKYHDKNKEDFKKRKIVKLKEELKELNK